ncbi:hypothetical protein GCM10022280_15790 [Sphingomonas swuensis]|uniref:TadE-like domain-containing protein n=1 Tax=Sphingomonas swuensis TaxID=977800 RepID=A0ABP7SW20_9SPHN
MSGPSTILRDTRGAAAAEMALVLPFLIALLFGSMELGNYFWQEHVVIKQVRDGARFASRLPLSADYDCADEVFAVDPDADYTPEEQILNVTTTGRVDGSGPRRFPSDRAPCGSATQAVSIAMRCVAKDDYRGIYTGLDGDIPVVKVSAALTYEPLFNLLGFDATGMCLVAESEVAVAGL